MPQISLSQTRLTQLRQMQARLGDDFEKVMTTHRAPTQLRVMAWMLSKVVNVTMWVAGLFQTPTRGDLSLLGFELMALGYFMPMRELIQIDEDIVRLSKEAASVVAELRRADMLEHPDVNHPLVQKYVRVVDEAEELIQRVHAEYRRHVVLL